MTGDATATAIDVLVVDDQPPFRRAARRMLAVSRFSIVGEATTGEEAVELARRLQPTLVLMDVLLPGIDGVEATRRILAQAPTTIVVLVSSRGKAELPRGLDSCGAAGFIQKEDFEPEALAALVG